ncbi:DUF4160 domain-containing protein [Desulfosarcina ovata]|uniref:DUF4160 domain-containing protein n=1 Tax=Desulfosarcina ovata subsp. ovata TaxID=2752305 RepID=A0A5K8A795_9BACT|nr:hypothetical protein DSCOOX_16830 [Desulfosarcina ovata subsp. ovata]
MPTIFRYGPYRFFFYSGDRVEPMHVHIEAEDNIAKIWLDPIRLENSGGFNRSEMGRILNIIREHQIELMEAWNGYFGS